MTKYGNSIPRFSWSIDPLRLDIENEDEPIHLDLGPVDYNRRITELQRRNLSQPKHLRTAYALETMDQDPDDYSASFIRKGGVVNDENAARQRPANDNQKGSEVGLHFPKKTIRLQCAFSRHRKLRVSRIYFIGNKTDRLFYFPEKMMYT